MVSDAGNIEKYFNKEQMEEYYLNYKLNNDPRITRIGRFLRKTSVITSYSIHYTKLYDHHQLLALDRLVTFHLSKC